MDQQFSKALEKTLRAWQSFVVDKLLMRNVSFAEEDLLVHSWAQKNNEYEEKSSSLYSPCLTSM